MDDIFENLPEHLDYKLGKTALPVVCYADDAVLMAECEEDLQILLNKFCENSDRLNMQVSTTKTKCMATAKASLRCNLGINNSPTEQVPSFNLANETLRKK